LFSEYIFPTACAFRGCTKGNEKTIDPKITTKGIKNGKQNTKTSERETIIKNNVQMTAEREWDYTKRREGCHR